MKAISLTLKSGLPLFFARFNCLSIDYRFNCRFSKIALNGKTDRNHQTAEGNRADLLKFTKQSHLGAASDLRLRRIAAGKTSGHR